MDEETSQNDVNGNCPCRSHSSVRYDFDPKGIVLSIAPGLDSVNVRHHPRLLSDNGLSYIVGGLAKWMDVHDMDHVRGAPYHPMTQDKTP